MPAACDKISRAFFLPQIEGDAFLIAIERAKARAVAFVFRIAPAVGVAAVGQFDFDHFAAEIAEQAARIGPGDVAADVDANSSFESSGNHYGYEQLPLEHYRPSCKAILVIPRGTGNPAERMLYALQRLPESGLSDYRRNDQSIPTDLSQSKKVVHRS